MGWFFLRIYFTASFVAQHVWPSSLKFRKITSPFPHYYIINYRLSQVSANPATYNITWRHNGKRLPEDVGAGIIIGNQTLVLQKVYLLVISIVNRHHHRQSSSQSSIVITIVNSHHHRQLSSPSSIVITIVNFQASSPSSATSPLCCTTSLNSNIHRLSWSWSAQSCKSQFIHIALIVHD